MGKATSLARGNSPSCSADSIKESKMQSEALLIPCTVYLYWEAVTNFIKNTLEVSGLPDTATLFWEEWAYSETDTPGTFTPQ